MRGKKIIDCKVAGRMYTRWGDPFWRQKIIGEVSPLVKTPISAACSVKLNFYIHEDRLLTNDVDNLSKSVLDALTDAKVYVNDACVVNLEATKTPINISDPEGLHIEIWEWTPEHP